MKQFVWIFIVTLSLMSLANAATPTPSNCTDATQGGISHSVIQDIVGLYSKSVDGQPAAVGRPEEKLHGFNYLAITPLTGNKIRLRLSTKEMNGHDCGIDSEAVICGRTIQLLPNEGDKATLADRKLPVPSLLVTKKQIAFIPYSKGNYVWGSPYCGAMGYLNQRFPRNSRQMKIDDALFEQ